MVHPAEIAEKIYMIDDQLYSVPQHGTGTNQKGMTTAV